MNLTKNLINIIVLAGLSFVFVVVCKIGYANEATPTPTNSSTLQKPFPTSPAKVHIQRDNLTPIEIGPNGKPVSLMTREEHEEYIKEEQESGNFESASKREMELEDEDIKNHKIKLHPYHSHNNVSVMAPNSPLNLKIEPGDGTASLAWDAMPRAVAYYVYISEDGINFKLRMNGSIQKHKIKIGSLKNGHTYYFGITSIGKGGESEKTIGRVTLK